MPSDENKSTDFINIVVADGTRIHTQLLAEAMRADRSLQVVASAPSSQELLDAVSRVPIDVAVISYALDDQPGRGLEALRRSATNLLASWPTRSLPSFVARSEDFKRADRNSAIAFGF